jgi:hypothetical protein
MYIHMWSASSSESIALLSDAESDSCFGLSEDPLVFDREPANLKTRSRAGLAGPRGPHKPVRSFPSFRFQAARRPAGPPAKCRARAGTDQPAPTQAEASDTATQGRPLTIVDVKLRMSRAALLAAQAAP